MSNQMLQLDVTKQSPTQDVIIGRQGDSALKMITVNLWDGLQNIPYNLTNKQVMFGMLKPDGTRYIDNGNIIFLNAKAGQFRYTFNEQAFTAAGNAKQAFFRITHADESGNLVADSTLDFGVNVKSDSIAFGINSQPYISDYERLVTALEQKFQDYASAVSDNEDKVIDIHNQINSLIEQIAENQLLIIRKTSIEADDIALLNLTDFSTSSSPLKYTNVGQSNNEPNIDNMGYIEAKTSYLKVMKVSDV